MTKKEEMKALAKTAEAYGTVSEDVSEKSLNEVSEEILEEKLPEEVVEEVKIIPERKRYSRDKDPEEELKLWKPKTKLGKEVKEGRIKDIDDILDTNKKILEPEIVDSLLKLKIDLLAIGQSKGKFGGGKRRAWRQTQRKKKEGSVPTFSSLAVVGDENGHVGTGYGRAKETLPARDKAVRKAKIDLIKIIRTCSSFDCNCAEKHTVPCKIEGKGGSCRVVLIPAPQGTGLVAANELKKVLKMAGIKDVYTKTFGSQRTTFNLVKACMDALNKTNNLRKK